VRGGELGGLAPAAQHLRKELLGHAPPLLERRLVAQRGGERVEGGGRGGQVAAQLPLGAVAALLGGADDGAVDPLQDEAQAVRILAVADLCRGAEEVGEGGQR
jgi:hypothetical protein